MFDRERIVQVISVNPVDREFGGRVLAPDASGTRNIQWKIIGFALTDSGRLLPLLYDGYLRTRTIDPAREELIASIERSIRESRTRTTFYDREVEPVNVKIVKGEPSKTEYLDAKIVKGEGENV